MYSRAFARIHCARTEHSRNLLRLSARECFIRLAVSQALLKNGLSHFLRYRATEWLTQTRDAHCSCACFCVYFVNNLHYFVFIIAIFQKLCNSLYNAISSILIHKFTVPTNLKQIIKDCSLSLAPH